MRPRKRTWQEMLVPYNAADKASPPQYERSDPNYFQPDVLQKILDALAFVSLRWRALIHFLIIIGCRRGEAVAVKWDKIDWEHSTVRIDRALVNSKKKGLIECSTKTRDRRILKLP